MSAAQTAQMPQIGRSCPPENKSQSSFGATSDPPR
jgi:hypothetical protein